MSEVIVSLSISLDGFVAGLDSGPEHSLGRGGESLHAWMSEPGNGAPIDFANDVGAVIIGNTMFRCGERPWGDENPWGRPVFVLTHTPREPVSRQGEIAFQFVTDGLDAALAQARTVAGDRDVLINGGADIARQYIEAGQVTRVAITIVPTLLGVGLPLFAGLDPAIHFTQFAADPRAGVTHITYAVSRSPTP